MQIRKNLKLRKKMRKLAFTLVEMLIVIVVIWILAGAILPKIMGIQARARDTKRQADLRNLSMAITTYKMDNGEYPQRTKLIEYHKGASHYAGSVWWLKDTLSDYIKEIPRDPQKNNSVERFYRYYGPDSLYKPYFPWGEYFYARVFNWPQELWLLVAKVETPNMANFVNDVGKWWLTFDCAVREFDYCDDEYILCSEIKKAETIKVATEDDTVCHYSDENQLFYIVKI